MGIIDELQATIQQVSENTGKSIVGIGAHVRGSGVVVAKDRVVTNAHNLRGDEVTVHFSDDRKLRGRVAGLDVDGDLAVIEVDTADAPALKWGAGDQLKVGSVVFGVAASSTGGVRVTFGTVSAIGRAFRGPGGRRISGSVEHTAPLPSGSSGGAIVDASGRLLGVNTNRLGEGFYLALPADATLRDRIDALGRGESAERPRLGIVVAPSFVARRLRASVGLPERDGVLVRGVEDGGPADRAGIVEGDLIVEIAGRPVTDADGLIDAMAAAKLPYQVGLVRGAEDRTVTVDGAAASADA